MDENTGLSVQIEVSNRAVESVAKGFADGLFGSLLPSTSGGDEGDSGGGVVSAILGGGDGSGVAQADPDGGEGEEVTDARIMEVYEEVGEDVDETADRLGVPKAVVHSAVWEDDSDGL